MKLKLPLIIALACPAVASAATLVGDTLTVRREIPSQNFLFGPFNTVVAAGLSDGVSLSNGNNDIFNPESSSLTFNFGPAGGSGGFIADHRIVVTDIDWFGEPGLFIGSVSAVGNVPGFAPSDVTFGPHSVTLNVGDFLYSGGQSVVVTLTAVPEPASLAALAAGSTVLLRRRR